MTSSLTIPLQEWLTAFTAFQKMKPPKRNNNSEFMFTIEDGHLVVSYAAIETRVEAAGNWSGTVYVQWSYLFGVVKVPPQKDPVLVEHDGTRLRIEGSFVPCRWTPSGTPAAPKPPSGKPSAPDPTFPTLVAMSLFYSDDKVNELGLAQLVGNAKKQREKLISEAATILGPLEITADDLRMLVMKTLGSKVKR